ncbi:uncharacterized protein LOC128956443 [Oppia nitens]|uniref:uncharacterized protein LOC128956443 n=1 Tax=Oppia nitens TaxID=1686743 RepID=UPI0023DC9107|nr:uncharacterized protein LOC128956443 [Oppia nitens]
MSTFFNIFILLSVMTAVLGTTDPQLEALAQNFLQLLNPSLADSKSHEFLLQLTNGHHLSANSSDSLKVILSFEGTLKLNAERNGQKLELLSQHLGGAAVYGGQRYTALNGPLDSDNKPVDPFLKNIYDKNLKTHKHLSDDETGVLIAHGSATGAQVVVDKVGKVESGLIGGFVVGAKTKINY